MKKTFLKLLIVLFAMQWFAVSAENPVVIDELKGTEAHLSIKLETMQEAINSTVYSDGESSVDSVIIVEANGDYYLIGKVIRKSDKKVAKIVFDLEKKEEKLY